MDAKKKKILIISGLIAAIGIGVTIAIVNRRKRQRLEQERKRQEEELLSQSQTETGVTEQIIKPETGNTQVQTIDGILTGKKCGTIHTNYDGDYDYVKCEGVWYTKSKPNPKSASAKGRIPNWTSLAGNTLANQRLNSKFPNG